MKYFRTLYGISSSLRSELGFARITMLDISSPVISKCNSPFHSKICDSIRCSLVCFTDFAKLKWSLKCRHKIFARSKSVRHLSNTSRSVISMLPSSFKISISMYFLVKLQILFHYSFGLVELSTMLLLGCIPV